jgi:hypothetical protein
MRKLLLIAAAAALALPAVAAAKGAESASISGPGVNQPLQLAGDSEMGQGTPLGMLSMAGGYFAQMFPQAPDPRLRGKPKGVLGPRYTVTYQVPGPNGQRFVIRQDLYPYAKPAPVTYMAPGQRFFDGRRSLGGWVQGSLALRQMLVKNGLPSSAPVSSAGFWGPGVVGGISGGVALLALGGFAYRRRITG